jgi:ESS family glutamate:Na+ symporter
LILQNLVGIAVALVRGVHPFYGLLAGSISFVGGPGTALAWAKEAQDMGLKNAELVAISAATFAVSVGAIVAGPIVNWIIKKHRLRSEVVAEITNQQEDPVIRPAASTSVQIRTMLIMAVAIGLGMQLNTYSIGLNLLLPGFLCSLLAGMLITNLADLRKITMPVAVTDRVGDLALQVFLAISLMSLKINSLGAILVPIVIVVILQVILCAAIAYYLLFRLLGKDYDAAVVSGGFIGFAVSSMPVAMATMEQITKRYGPAPKAILLITLAGSFFVDLANSFIVKGFMAILPAIHH